MNKRDKRRRAKRKKEAHAEATVAGVIRQKEEREAQIIAEETERRNKNVNSIPSNG